LAFSLLGIDTFLAKANHFEKNIVGIGPMSYFDPRIWPKKDQDVYMNYLNKLAEFILWLIHQGFKIILFPGEAIHDTVSSEDLKVILARAGEVFNPAQLLQPKIETVGDLMPQLATADLIVASRFHGVLLSMLLHKPLVALSYHPKVDELMADTGQSHYCLQIQDFDVETLKARFTELAANREIASQQITTRVKQYRNALDEQYERIFGCL
jgi:polysaccharide pyruvyl transferase WcaK-like protein